MTEQFMKLYLLGRKKAFQWIEKRVAEIISEMVIKIEHCHRRKNICETKIKN